MRIEEPNCEYWKVGDSEQEQIEHVCRCAQISYQSTPKTGEKAKVFYEGLIKSQHLSTLRHRSYYYIVPDKEMDNLLRDWLKEQDNNPYLDYEYGYIDDSPCVFIATNGQFIYEHGIVDAVFEPYRVTAEEFQKTKFGKSLMRFTFCLTTQISTSREVPARHSPQNITELSTRYVKDHQAIVRPHWMTLEEVHNYKDHGVLSKGIKTPTFRYLDGCRLAFDTYNWLTTEGGMKPEDARGILPMDTMTKVIATYSVAEWSKMIQMRYYGTTGRPHPNAKILLGLVKQELEKLGYEFDRNGCKIFENLSL